MESNKDTWSKILHIIITILTAIAASLTTQSCIKHKTIQTRESYPMVTLATMPETTPTVLYTLQGFTQEEVVLLKQLIEHERMCAVLHATDLEYYGNTQDAEIKAADSKTAKAETYKGEYVTPPLQN